MHSKTLCFNRSSFLSKLLKLRFLTFAYLTEQLCKEQIQLQGCAILPIRPIQTILVVVGLYGIIRSTIVRVVFWRCYCLSCRTACVVLWRCLWYQDLFCLVDSNSWRGSIKYYSLLTRSIFIGWFGNMYTKGDRFANPFCRSNFGD